MERQDHGFVDITPTGPVDDWPTGRLFAAAAKLWGPVMWRVIDQHGISPAGFLILRSLLGRDGQRPGELARQMMITPASVTSVIGTLERNGHVERRRDPTDRRAVLVHITGSGRRLAVEGGQELSRDLRRFYVIDEADEPAVRRFLIQLIDRFRAYSGGDTTAAGAACGPADATARPADGPPAGRTAEPPPTPPEEER
ncbi:MarR family winged helix-turn-helix transcriptional regulator [Actinomadura sp. 21ATH]|uniref:MarR family winged helix-turn-helix transcriptional regulator n=1 Tax=Actinomadura sp. 21ATH TaxID=1735444 RepID=UPI0035C0F4CF